MALVIGVFLIYSPVRHAGFVWDDTDQLQANPCIIGPLGLKDIWTTSSARFFPMTLTTFWAVHAIFGLNPVAYHLLNVALHASSALVLWLTLQRLRIPGAWLGAALWAVHPVEVESVAWIAEMKNTQSALFFLLSIYFFAGWLQSNREGQRNFDWRYALTMLFLVLAMLSKSSTVVLPLVLGLCAWWVEGRLRVITMVSLMPAFVLAAANSAMAIWAVRQEGIANHAQWALTFPERLITAGYALWFYLTKLIWPSPLIAIYPHWTVDTGNWVSYTPLLATCTVLVVLGWWISVPHVRGAFFALAYFLVALLPVLGFFYHNYLQYSSVADHFQYLASMGPLALTGAIISILGSWLSPAKSWISSVVLVFLLLGLASLSWRRAQDWENQQRLWTDTLVKNPNCWAACNNLGDILFQDGRVDDAQTLFQKAAEINPESVNAHNNLGIILFQRGQVENAIEQFQAALAINGNYELAHNGLGAAYMQMGRTDDAIIQFTEFVRFRPNSAIAHSNLGNALLQRGRVEEAVAQYQEALRLRPDYEHARESLAKAEAMEVQTPEVR